MDPAGTTSTVAASRVELRHLRHFAAVARELHITRAARRLHLSQQALSGSIHRLETHLGVRLLDRTPHGVALTRAGEALLADVPALLEDVEAACLRVRQTALGPAQRPRLGHTGLADPLVPLLLGELRAGPAPVDVAARRLCGDDLLAALRRGRLDVALMLDPGPEAGEGLRFAPLRDEALVLVPGDGHPLPGGDPVRWATLGRAGPVLVPSAACAPGLEATVRSWARSAGVELELVADHRLDDPGWTATATGSGGVPALLPASAAESLAPWGIGGLRSVEGARRLRMGLVDDPAAEDLGTRRLRRGLAAAAARLGWSTDAAAVADAWTAA